LRGQGGVVVLNAEGFTGLSNAVKLQTAVEIPAGGVTSLFILDDSRR
jgi:hypothetical protein